MINEFTDTEKLFEQGGKMSRPALGPTQPPVQLVPGLSRG